MAEKEKKKKEDRVKPGGRPPRYYLKQSVDLAMKIYEDAGGNSSLDELASITGNTQKSSAFVAKLSALKNYGIVVANDNKVKLSDIGERIATPEDQADKNAGLKSAFLLVEPFKVVYDKFVGKLLPQGEFLKNSFSNQENIPQQLADEWADHFINSGKYAGLLMDRGDGKLQVRGTASDKPNGNDAEASQKQPIEEKPDEIDPQRRELPPAASQAKTPYDFLVEIFKGAEMDAEEEKAVFTLFRFLKKQELGTKSKTVIRDDSESSSA